MTQAAPFTFTPEILTSLPGVIIDDNESEAMALFNGLRQAGLHTTPLIFNRMKLEHADKYDLSSTRLVFLDLNLLPGTGQANPNSIAPANAIALKALNLKGPYVLIIWSDNVNIAQGVLKNIFTRDGKDLPPPVTYVVFSKSDFLLPPRRRNSKKRDYDHARIASSVLDSLKDIPTLLALASWQNKVNKASGDVVSRVFSTVGDVTTEKFLKEVKKNPPINIHNEEKLGAALFHISCAAVGVHHISENEGCSAAQGLFPLLEDHLCRNDLFSIGENELWKKILQDSKVFDETSKSILNNAYLLDSSIDNSLNEQMTAALHPGLLCFACDSDACIKDFFSDKLECKELKREFLRKPRKEDPDYNNLSKVQFNAIEKAYNELANQCHFGILQQIAPCDHANGKTSYATAFLCCIAPSDANDFFYKKKDSLYISPSVNIEGKTCTIIISFNHVARLSKKRFSTCNSHSCKGIRLRNQIMIDIARNYGNHLSRPGMIYLSGQ